MNKVLLTVTVLSLMAGVASLSTQAVTPTSALERGYVSVTSSANTELSPDVAQITIAVQTYDSKSMQKATAENKELSDKVYAALKSMINTANGDFVKTSDFSASPVYSYSGSKRNFDKYQVNNSIIVKTKSIDKVGSMIDKAISLGATNVNDLAFSVSDTDVQCDGLLETATKKAQAQANTVAKSVSSAVTGIRSLEVSCSANNSRTPYKLMMARNVASGEAMDGASTSTTIESGMVKIYANVNASFFVR